MEFGTKRAEDEVFLQLDPHKKIKRSCTDIICCLIFLLCIGGAVAIAVIAYLHGDPRRLVHPTDSLGNLCGYGDLKHRPNLFYFDLLQCVKVASIVDFGCPTSQVCVAECPSTFFSFLQGSQLEKATDLGEQLAKEVISNGFVATFDERIEKALQGSQLEKSADLAKKMANEFKSDSSKAPEAFNEEIRKVRHRLICRDGVDAVSSKESIASLIQAEKCAPYYVPSQPVLYRCMPTIFKNLKNTTSTLKSPDEYPLVNKLGELTTASKLAKASRVMAHLDSAKTYSEMLLYDLMTVWWHILIGMLLVYIYSFAWIYLLEAIGSPVIIFGLVAFIAIFAFCSFVCLTRYWEMEDGMYDLPVGLLTAFVDERTQYKAVKYTWLAMGCTAAALGIFLFLIAIVVIKHIQLSVVLIKHASKAIWQMPLTVLWPIWPFILQMIVVFFWVISAVNVATMGENEYAIRNFTFIGEEILTTEFKGTLPMTPCQPSKYKAVNTSCEFIKQGGKEYTIHMQVYLAAMFLWMMNFTVALDQLTLAGAFSIHYWTPRRRLKCIGGAIFVSHYRAVRYHLGSLAFGSLVIAFAQAVRVCLEYIDQRLRMAQNNFAAFILKCMKCCVWCMEMFLQFLNRNAYIMMAMYGKNFFTSSKDAFQILMRNIVAVGMLNKVVDFVTAISRLTITAGTGALAYLWFVQRLEGVDRLVPDLNFHMFPVLLMILGALLVTSLLFNIIDIAVDTLFLCVLEDVERNDGSLDRPYFMSQDMRDLLGLG